MPKLIKDIKARFLEQYSRESYDKQKKMEYLFYFNQIGVLLFLGLIMVRIFGNSNMYLIIGDAFLGLFLLVSLIGIYFRKPFLAGNTANFLPFTILFYHVVEDYQLGIEIPLDSLFASLAFIIFGYLYLSLFAIRRRQLFSYTAFSAIMLVGHYYVIVQNTFNGEVNSLNMTHLIAVMLGLGASAMMAILLLRLLHEVMRLANEARQVTERKYTSLFNNLQDAFGYFKLIYHGQKAIDLKVLEYNEALRNLLGINEKKKLQNVILAEDDIREELKGRLAFWKALFDQVINNKQEYIDEFYSEALDAWFLVTVFSPYSDECVLLMQDISGMKQQQQELEKAKDKAEESDKLKSSFLNTISHEVRTPLNQIIGLVQVIKDQYSNDEELEEMTRLISHSAAYLTDIIDNLLEASLMHSSNVEPKISRVFVNEELEKAVSFTKDQIRVMNKQDKIQFSLDNSVSENMPVVHTDSHMLSHVLKKLLSNAVKYTSEGQIKMSVYQEGSFLVFRICDTGAGIEKEKKEIIFDPFRQADEGTTRKHGGLGLGLAISSYFANKLGGKIDFTSTPGEGSNFYFRHPIK